MSTYPAWYQRHAPDGWSEGDVVEHDSQLWIATAGGEGGNTWEPGAYGWAPFTAPEEPEPSLRELALAAFEQARNATETAARDALAGVVGEPAAVELDLVDTSEGPGWRLLVFTDGDLHLGVRERDTGRTVHLVADDGGWVERSEPLGSLVDLGAALAGASQ